MQGRPKNQLGLAPMWHVELVNFDPPDRGGGSDSVPSPQRRNNSNKKTNTGEGRGQPPPLVIQIRTQRTAQRRPFHPAKLNGTQEPHRVVRPPLLYQIESRGRYRTSPAPLRYRTEHRGRYRDTPSLRVQPRYIIPTTGIDSELPAPSHIEPNTGNGREPPPSPRVIFKAFYSTKI